MAAWLKPFLLALLAALCVHALGLISIGSQMKASGTVLSQQNDPLFTRTIEAASAPETAAQPQPDAKPTDQATAKVMASQVTLPNEPTQTLAEPLEQTPTPTAVSLAANTASNPPLTDTSTPTTLTADISTPAQQTRTTQPTGQTNTLLATGDWPGDTRVSYRLTGFYQGELFGKGEVQWTRTGQNRENYQVRVVIDAGLLEFRMTSQGRVSAQGLLPQVFEEYRKLALQSPRIRPLKLEDEALVLENGRRLPRPSAEPMAVQDTVSQFVDLGHRFSQGRAKLEAGQVVRIWLGRPGGLDEWIYDVGEAETMELPRIGSIRVHQLSPRPIANPRGPYKISIWLAPSLQYLPAKIRLDVGGDNFVDLIAERLEQR